MGGAETEIRKNATTAVVVSRAKYRGRWRLDVREFYVPDPSRPGERRPTRRGVNVPIDLLPALRAALEEAEHFALASGLLEFEDYENAGLTPPAALLART